MSEPVTPLGGAIYDSGIARVSDVGPVGMITLRGDLTAKALINAAKQAAGVNVPGQRMILTEGARGMAWMSPDELLIICPHDEAHARTKDLSDALANSHALAVNVSDARAVFEVHGPHARDVIAKLAPVDTHAQAFTVGDFRRTRLAQVGAAIWMTDDQTFRVVCFRSVAQYMFDLLAMAAQPGSERTA